MIQTNKITDFVRDNKEKIFITFLLFLVIILCISIFNGTYGRIAEGPTGSSNSRLEGNTLYVDDLIADYNYLKGLNFTEVRSTSIPSGTSTGFYDNDNLVKVTIIYDGADINNPSLVGAVSPINNENANKYIYYKYYALERNSDGTLATNENGDNYIHIELIDNPFSKRPYVNMALMVGYVIKIVILLQIYVAILHLVLIRLIIQDIWMYQLIMKVSFQYI